MAHESDAATSGPGEVPFASNAVRLSPREWGVALALIAALLLGLPRVWKRLEPLGADADYRVPYSLGYDYWIFRRHCRDACAEGRTLVLGDSVVWGHFVSAEQTLSHYLNELAGEARFANLGVDGIHPAALAGLVEHYGRAIADRRVLLHCNLLWMSTEEADLQDEKERPFNHPHLVPQFFPSVPCYKEPFSGRLAIVVGRHLPYWAWASHLRIAYFGRLDIPTWTLEHPRENPARRITLELPSPNEPPSPEPVPEPWTKRHERYSPPWVELATSLQWRLFRRTVETLRRRGNRVFVLVGPFNEHMLEPESLAAYVERKAEVAAWLQEQGIPHCIAAPLPSDAYADDCHPLSGGYARLARRLFEDEAFARFDGRGGEAPEDPSK